MSLPFLSNPDINQKAEYEIYVNNLACNNLQMITGASNGYILKSDASGNASWAAEGGTGSLNSVVNANGTNFGFTGGVLYGNMIQNLGTAGSVTFANIKLTSGATNGYVLTSDASGNASWAAEAATGALNSVTNANGTNLGFTGGVLYGNMFQNLGTGGSPKFVQTGQSTPNIVNYKNLNSGNITTSGSKQCGFGGTCTFMPVLTGNVKVTFFGQIGLGNNNNDNAQIGIMTYGTGSAPSANAAQTGVGFGNSYNIAITVVGTTMLGHYQMYLLGLAINRTYWFDACMGDSGNGANVTLSNGTCIIEEF